ncbi:MAG: hypothetical protein AAGJ54_02085 [Planctomycetota bacterium]
MTQRCGAASNATGSPEVADVHKLAFVLAASGVAITIAPALGALAQDQSETQPQAPAAADQNETDGVLMEWSLGTGSIALVREGNTISMVGTSADGEETLRQRVRLVADQGKLAYLPMTSTDGRFFIVKADGALELHDPSGEVGFAGLTPELVSVRDDQQKVLDSIAPVVPAEEPSWADVIDSLSGGSSGDAGGAAGSRTIKTDPNRLDIEELEDGTKRINDRFVLAGEGTQANPYQVTWDYLTSARDTYRPRDGFKDIPAHVKMLDGKFIRLGGYLQFPLASAEPKELLVMLNQWDGCCIGVPPTPYDAIEVALSQPATRGEKFAVEGALVGKLTIDPYLVGDWLIGLYLLGDASLDVSGSRTAEEVFGNAPTVGDPDAMPHNGHGR